MGQVKKQLLEALIRECVREVLDQISEETIGAPAPPADGLGTADQPSMPQEVTQKDIKQRIPSPAALSSGDIKLNMMTLDNLKSLRTKIKTMIPYYKQREDTDLISRAMSDYELVNNEIKRRLSYINNPVAAQNEKMNELKEFIKKMIKEAFSK